MNGSLIAKMNDYRELPTKYNEGNSGYTHNQELLCSVGI